MFSFGTLTSFFKKWWLPLLFCVVLPTAVVGNVIQRHSQFSPIDEGAHFDYVERLYSHGIPVMGDRMLTSSLREMACRGTALEGIITPPCDAKKFPYDQWPGGAWQYQSQQPPLYYAVTAPVAKALDVVIGRGVLGSIRLVSLIWLIGGLLLMWKTALLLGISRLTTAAGLMLVGLAPTVVYYSAIVTNDAAGIFFGALVCYIAALAHVHQRSYAKYAIAIGVAAALSKISCVLPPVIIGAALILVSLQQSEGIATLRSVASLRTWWNSSSGKTYARTGTALLVSSVAATLAWVVYFNVTATIAPETLPTFDVMRAPGFQVTTILNQAMTFFAPFTDSYQPFQFWNKSVFDILHLAHVRHQPRRVGALRTSYGAGTRAHLVCWHSTRNCTKSFCIRRIRIFCHERVDDYSNTSGVTTSRSRASVVLAKMAAQYRGANAAVPVRDTGRH